MTGSSEQLMKATKIIRDATGLSEMNLDSKPLDAEGNASYKYTLPWTVHFLLSLKYLLCIHTNTAYADHDRVMHTWPIYM